MARKDGDAIRAIILNVGVNQDGKTAGLTMPNGDAQTALIDKVYRNAGLDPIDTDYVEFHGTGTAVGDPIECAAVSKAFNGSPRRRPIIIGSLKSNLGHLESVSGIAAMIKAALMLERRFIVPNCDLRSLNSKIPFEKLNLKVSKDDDRRPWYMKPRSPLIYAAFIVSTTKHDEQRLIIQSR